MTLRRGASRISTESAGGDDLGFGWDDVRAHVLNHADLEMLDQSAVGYRLVLTKADKIKEAKVSHRLKTHPVCLTAGEGFSFEMEKYFKNFQMPEPIKAERILELNVDHPAVKAMAAALATDRDKAALYAKILYDQANLIAGLPLEDPSAYTDMVAQLMQ